MPTPDFMCPSLHKQGLPLLPEMHFDLRWPDGSAMSCYSPSLVITDYFDPGASYTLTDFLDRARTALGEASERVRLRYGFACARALAQLDRIEQRAVDFATTSDAAVTVTAFHRNAES